MSTPISGLSSGTPAQNTDEFLIARSGANYKLTLTDIISAEETRAKAAEAILDTNIGTEASDRAAADLVLTNAISAEVAARIAADANKLDSSYLDTDITLAANSDVKIPSQKAIKTYVDGLIGTATEIAAGTLEVATNAETSTGTADDKIVTPLKLATVLPVGVDSGTKSLITKSAFNTNSGDYSVALGQYLTVSGDYSTALGQGVIASGNYSFSGGTYDVNASGLSSFAWHYNVGGYGPIPTSYVGSYSALLGGQNCNLNVTNSAAIACTETAVTANYIVALGRQTETLNQSYTTYTRTLNIKGGIQKRISSTSALTYAPTYQENIIVADSASNNVTITLPASPVSGQEMEITRTSASNVVTADGNGKNINGAGTKVLTAAAYAKIRIIYTGTEWLIMDEI